MGYIEDLRDKRQGPGGSATGSATVILPAESGPRASPAGSTLSGSCGAWRPTWFGASGSTRTMPGSRWGSWLTAGSRPRPPSSPRPARTTTRCWITTSCLPSGSGRWRRSTRWRFAAGWPAWSAGDRRRRGPSTPTTCCSRCWRRPSRPAPCSATRPLVSGCRAVGAGRCNSCRRPR